MAPEMCIGLPLLHRALVPEAHEISVGILELGPVSPVGLARAMRERDASPRPLGVRGIDVVDLKPERAPEGLDARRHLLQEDREVAAVLERDCLPIRVSNSTASPSGSTYQRRGPA